MLQLNVNEPKFQVGQQVGFSYPSESYRPKHYVGKVEHITGHSEITRNKNGDFETRVTWNYKIKVPNHNGYNQHYSGIREWSMAKYNGIDYIPYYKLLNDYGFNIDSGRFIIKSFSWKHEKDSGNYYMPKQEYEVQLTDRILNRVITLKGVAKLEDVNKLSTIS